MKNLVREMAFWYSEKHARHLEKMRQDGTKNIGYNEVFFNGEWFHYTYVLNVGEPKPSEYDDYRLICITAEWDIRLNGRIYSLCLERHPELKQ